MSIKPNNLIKQTANSIKSIKTIVETDPLAQYAQEQRLRRRRVAEQSAKNEDEEEEQS